jgi:hypothetical protein
MKCIVHASTLLLLFGLPVYAAAQDKTTAEAKTKADQKVADEQRAKQEPVSSTPVRVQVVFSESENGKLTKSLPYTMYFNAVDEPEVRRSNWSRLRIGSKVPVYAGSSDKGDNIQYVDVGTNLDGRASNTGDHFLIELRVERSWVEGDVAVPVRGGSSSSSDSGGPRFAEPIIRSFRTDFDLALRNGQTIESTLATDPLSGKVMRVEVTLATLK